MKIWDVNLTLGKLDRELKLKREELIALYKEYDWLKSEVVDQRRAKTESYSEKVKLDDNRYNLCKQIEILQKTSTQWQLSFIHYTEKQNKVATWMKDEIKKLWDEIIRLEKIIEDKWILDWILLQKKEELVHLNWRIWEKEELLKQYTKNIQGIIEQKSEYLQSLADKAALLDAKEQIIAKREEGLRINLQRLTKLKHK